MVKATMLSILNTVRNIFMRLYGSVEEVMTMCLVYKIWRLYVHILPHTPHPCQKKNFPCCIRILCQNSLTSIHVISPDFGGSSRFGAFPHGLTLGRRNLPTRGFSNVIFLGPYFSPNILSFTAVSTWRINCLQRQKCLTFIDLIDDH